MAGMSDRANSRAWIALLPDDVAATIREIRDEWRANGGQAKKTATALARSICKTLTSLGYKMPKFTQVQRWLTEKI